MSTMEVLITNNSGTHFNPTLLRNIEHRYNAEILSALQDVNPSYLKDSIGMTLLHFAAEYGHDEFARYLINSRVNVDAQNQAQETPLTLAVENNRIQTVNVLLEAGADIFLPNVYGRCALGKALRVETNVSENIATALLSKVTSESLRDSKYITSEFHIECPLYHFVALRNADVTRVLLEKGSPVNVQKPSNGDTALHEAVERRDWESVKVLIKHNANLEIKNQKGKVPLESILIEDSDDHGTMLEVLKVMIQVGHGYDRCAKIAHGVLRYGNRVIVRAALSCISNLQAKSPSTGENLLEPLFHLCTNKTPGIHEELRGFDFDVNARCNRGRTMLHWAVEAGNPGNVRFLLGRGADVNAKDHECRTPLRRLFDCFTLMCSGEAPLDDVSFKSCVEILLEHDADPRTFMQGAAYSSMSKFESKISNKFVGLVEPILARLALLKVDGRGVAPLMRRKIASMPQFDDVFSLNMRYLEEMKNIEIDESVSLLDFYAESERKMSRYALNKRLVSNVEHAVMTICIGDSYCHYKLCERFLKVNALVKLREKTATTLKAILIELFDVPVYNIAEKIVSYVSDKYLFEML